VGNLTNVDYAVNPDLTLRYDALNRVTNMVDAVGTTVYGYTPGGRLASEDGPWSSDTVTNGYFSRVRTNLSLQQPAGFWTNRFTYDAAKRLATVTSWAGTFGYTLGGASEASPLTRKLALPNGSYITNAYDGNARLLFTKLFTSGGSLLDASTYGYNAGNQRTGVTRTDGSTVGLLT
jgi:YD repeat-containing protein